MYRRQSQDYSISNQTYKVSDKQKAKLTTKRNASLAKAKKYSTKAKSIEAKNKALAGGTRAYNYTKKQSVGKALVKSYIFGSGYGALKYNQARSEGASRGKAAVQGMLYGIGNQLSVGALSVVEPRLNRKK